MRGIFSAVFDVGRARTGAALLLVLWAIAFLMFILVATSAIVGDNALFASNARADIEAWLQARSGLAVAADPSLEAWDPVLRNDRDQQAGFQASVTSESALPNLNTMLLARGEAGHRFLEDLFRLWGMSEGEAEVLVERMADYVDADNAARLNGAESEAYAESGREFAPPNRPFLLAEEAAGVMGADALEALQPGWTDRFTTFSSGAIDLTSAGADVIASATGVSLSMAEDFVSERNGADGLPQTEDDLLPESVEEAMLSLGIDVAGVPVTIDDNIVRIESSGWAGDGSLRIVEVRKRGSVGDSGLLYYREGK